MAPVEVPWFPIPCSFPCERALTALSLPVKDRQTCTALEVGRSGSEERACGLLWQMYWYTTAHGGWPHGYFKTQSLRLPKLSFREELQCRDLRHGRRGPGRNGPPCDDQAWKTE